MNDQERIEYLKGEISWLRIQVVNLQDTYDETLDKYLKLKFQVEKMLINGSWYTGAIEGNPKIDFAEVEVEIKQIIEWQGGE